MRLFNMYRLEPLANFDISKAGVGGRVTVKVLFESTSYENPDEKRESYTGSFTGKLVAILTGDDNEHGRMFFEDGIEIIYDKSKIPSSLA